MTLGLPLCAFGQSLGLRCRFATMVRSFLNHIWYKIIQWYTMHLSFGISFNNIYNSSLYNRYIHLHICKSISMGIFHRNLATVASDLRCRPGRRRRSATKQRIIRRWSGSSSRNMRVPSVTTSSTVRRSRMASRGQRARLRVSWQWTYHTVYTYTMHSKTIRYWGFP